MTTDIERGGMDVSGPHEPSYYEIALTNRQVVVAFVILLVCVVAAFLSGVWIGRESTARAQEKLALLSRAAAAGDAAAGDKEKPEGQALQEFKFFADSHRRQDKEKSAGSRAGAPQSPSPEKAAPRDAAPAQASAPASSTASSAAAAAGAPAASTAAGRAGAAASRAAARPAPGEAAGEGEVGSPRGETDTTLRPEAPPTQRRRPDESARAASNAGAASGSRTAGEVVIQVFSSADKDQADKVRDRLVSAGLTAFLSPIAKNGQTMYRVRIGPFPSRPVAETVAEKVRKEHKLDTWITPK